MDREKCTKRLTREMYSLYNKRIKCGDDVFLIPGHASNGDERLV